MDTTDYGWFSRPPFIVVITVAIAILWVQVYIIYDYFNERTPQLHDELTPGFTERTPQLHDELTPGFTDRLVEFIGIQRSDLMTTVFYIALFILTLYVIMFMSLVYLFLKETMYSRWFGHTLTAERKILMEMNVRLEEMCKCLHENSILKILEELKNFRTETSTAIETITNSPTRLTNGATPLNNQVLVSGNDSSEITTEDEGGSNVKVNSITKPKRTYKKRQKPVFHAQEAETSRTKNLDNFRINLNIPNNVEESVVVKDC